MVVLKRDQEKKNVEEKKNTLGDMSNLLGTHEKRGRVNSDCIEGRKAS